MNKVIGIHAGKGYNLSENRMQGWIRMHRNLSAVQFSAGQHRYFGGDLENNRDNGIEEFYCHADREAALHDIVCNLRTSIASVLRHASLIRSESQEMSTRQNIEKLYLEVHNTLKVFDNLISARSNSNISSHDICDASSIASQAASVLDYQLRSKGIMLDIILSPEPLPVRADAFLLQQAFYFVLLNAMQILIESHGDKMIRLSGGIERELVKIDIAMISASSFECRGGDFLRDFFQTIEKGMGIGWYTLQKTIVGLGGSVSIMTGDNRTFSISLPYAASDSTVIAEEKNIRSGYRSDLLSERPSALIIDDEEMTGMVTADMMKYIGFEAVYFNCPIAALPLLRERSFNIIMIDYLMPKVNGIDFIMEHSSLFQDTQIILMTGLSSLDVSGVEKVCKVSVLNKPFALKELTCLTQEMKTKIRQQSNE